MYEWIVIGGGIHGCTVASFLIKNKKVTTDKIRVIDPHREPMHRWRKNTEQIGMEFLRSPGVHQIDVDPYSLQKFVRKQNRSPYELYGKYKRPGLNLFNEHSDSVIKETNLMESWHQGLVSGVSKVGDSWKVITETGETLQAANIVIAISINNQLNMPQWASELKEQLPSQVYHIFDNRLDNLETLEPAIAVVGGGITAAHLSIKLSKMFPGKVILIKRHPFRVHDFDSDPGWLGPKNLTAFQKIQEYEERRNVIIQSRNKGSLPRELLFKLKKLEKDNALTIIDGEVEHSYLQNGKDIVLNLGNGSIQVKSVLLATGFTPTIPGEHWVKRLIKEQNLQCAKCGYPIVNKTLQWCPHLYVSGPLAELEVGPIARNISGARHAAERIVASL